jgi:hypothetical protein
VIIFCLFAWLAAVGGLVYANHEQKVVIDSLDEKAKRLEHHCSFERLTLQSMFRWLSATNDDTRSTGEAEFITRFRHQFIELGPCTAVRPDLDVARNCIQRHDLECMRDIAARLLAATEEFR